MTDDKGILIQNIYYMLTYAFQELRQNNYEQIAGEKFDEIHDLFAEILIRGISFQLKQGLHKEYITHNQSLTTLKGKLDIHGSIKHKLRNEQRLSCEYDELSENNLFNQIIKTTSNLLIHHSEVKRPKKIALKKLMLYFDKVEILNRVKDIKWNMLRFDRNSKTYQMLLYICYFIIDGMLMTNQSGEYKMRSFTDEHMCRLFEKFVLEFYKKHHPEFKPRAAQISWNILEEEPTVNMLPIMQTDIMLTKGERTLIIDTKYYGQSMQYQYDKPTIHSHNLYQILAYVNNYDVGHTGKVDGMLLYAKTQEEIVPNGHFTTHDGNIIHYRNLDLNQDFAHIKLQLEQLVL